MKYMKPQSLRCFLAAAREENITKAASFHHLTSLPYQGPFWNWNTNWGSAFPRGKKRPDSHRSTPAPTAPREEILSLVGRTEEEMIKGMVISGDIYLAAGAISPL